MIHPEDCGGFRILDDGDEDEDEEEDDDDHDASVFGPIWLSRSVILFAVFSIVTPYLCFIGIYPSLRKTHNHNLVIQNYFSKTMLYLICTYRHTYYIYIYIYT